MSQEMRDKPQQVTVCDLCGEEITEGATAYERSSIVPTYGGPSREASEVGSWDLWWDPRNWAGRRKPTVQEAREKPPMERLRAEYLKMRQEAHYGFVDLYAAEWDRAIAAHDAQVKAEALREASAQCSNVAFGLNADVAEWLLDRADRIEQEGAGQ